MRVNIKLHGTLRQGFPGYRPSMGIELELPDGATVKDLLANLEIFEARGAAVIAGGRVLKADDRIEDGSSLDVFQSISGG